MRRNRFFLAASIVIAVVASFIAGYIVRGPFSPYASDHLVASPPSGIYVDGPPGTPHYFISLSSASSGTISGALDFVFQDGQTSVIFTFTGTAQSGIATIFDKADNTYISAALGPKSLDLGDCTQFLNYATSLADCEFSYSSTGPN